MSERTWAMLGLAGAGLLIVAFLVALVWGIWKTATTPTFDPAGYAAQKGWQFIDGPRNFEWTLRPPDGGWRLEQRPSPFYSNTSADRTEKHLGTTLFIERKGPRDKLVLLTDHVPEALRDMMFSGMKAMGGSLSGDPVLALLIGSTFVKTGDAAFDARFDLATNNVDYARQVVNEKVRSQLLKFVEQVGFAPQNIAWEPEGIVISLKKEERPEVVEALLALGMDVQAMGRQP